MILFLTEEFPKLPGTEIVQNHLFLRKLSMLKRANINIRRAISDFYTEIIIMVSLVSQRKHWNLQYSRAGGINQKYIVWLSPDSQIFNIVGNGK